MARTVLADGSCRNSRRRFSLTSPTLRLYSSLFAEAVERIVEDFDAIPHWGHLHTAADLHAKYPRHVEWRDALNTIAREAGRQTTFRQRFARTRGLLEDL